MLVFPGKPKSRNSSDYKAALVAGGCLALAALLSSGLILLAARGNDWQVLIFTSTVAAFIIGTLLWRLFFSPGRKPSVLMGLGVGALVGFLSHPLAWYLTLVWVYIGGGTSSLGDRTIDPLNALWASFAYSAFSWLIVGWITVPLGGAVGAGLAFVAGQAWEQSAGLQGLSHGANYSEIDPVLYAWAQKHGLQIFMKYQSYDVRSVFLTSNSGEPYQIWVDAPDERKEVHLHARDYTNMRADIISSLHDLDGKLEEIYATVRSWDAAGNRK
jgi:hypothetical protein